MEIQTNEGRRLHWRPEVARMWPLSLAPSLNIGLAPQPEPGQDLAPAVRAVRNAEHCFIESVQFLVPAQGGGVFLRQPEKVQQEEEAEQERHPSGAAGRGGNGQDECGELLVSHLFAQLLRLPPADSAAGMQALREHLPQRGEPELQECRTQPWLPPYLHRAGPSAAWPHHQRHAAAWGEICSSLLHPSACHGYQRQGREGSREIRRRAANPTR